MCRELIHIYGPIFVCGYGVMVFVAIILFAYLVNRDPVRRSLMSSETFADILLLGTFAGFAGGRILFICTNGSSFASWSDYLAVWDGGFSLLGSIIGILVVLPFHLLRRKVSVVPFFDLTAVYAPLLQGVSRFGCFLSGCCYGTSTNLPWAIVYHERGADAPLGIPIHPTQLYSAALLFCVFLFMYGVVLRKFHKSGQLILTYLSLAGMERFIVDFWRADREFFACDHWHLLSLHQYIALALSMSAFIALLIVSQKPRQRHYESV